MPGYLKIFLLALYVVTGAANTFGQDSIPALQKALPSETREIDLARISIESSEIIFNVSREMRQIISDRELAELQLKNGIALAEVDSLLKYRKDSNLEMKNIRSIKNSINYWKQQLLEVQAIDLQITGINKELDRIRLKYAKELGAWRDIEEKAREFKYSDAVMGRISKVISLLDTSIFKLGHKSAVTLEMLDKTNRLMLVISERVDRYDDILITKQRNVFRTGHPGFLELEYNNPEYWKVSETFELLHRGELKALGRYFHNHINVMIFHFILLVVFILILVFLKKHGIPEGEQEDLNYRRSLKIIISNPGNSALILGLFASTLLYPNKPILFSDLFKLIVSIPLAITLLNMAHRKYRSVIIAFEILVILQIINANLPTHLIQARILLLVTAIVEIHTLASFISKVKRSSWGRPDLLRFVLFLSYIHLALAITGVFTNLAGKVILTQSLLNAVSGTALATVLIFLAMLVGNGLMLLFLDSKTAQNIHVIRKRRILFKENITRIFQWAAFGFMVYYIMEAYGFEIYIRDWLSGFLQKERALGSVSFTWGKILIFFLVIWMSMYLSKWIRIFLEEEVLDRMGLSKGLPNTIALLVRYTLVTLGFLAAASMAGLKMTNLTIILGAMSVGIGFGLQNIFNNLVSGLILLLERPIKIGDTIEVGPLIGVVKKIGIRASNVHTVDGAEIIVPNGNLVSSEVINWTLTDKRRRIEVLVGVAYGSDPYRVQDIFMKILSSHPEVVVDPMPNVLFNNFGESSLDFRLLFWTDNFDEWIRIRSEIIFQIHDALNEAGITIPFPQRDVHLYSRD